MGSEMCIRDRSVTADENGAAMLTGILICVADATEAVERYERFTGKPSRPSGDGYRIALDRGEIAICTPDECAVLIPGVDIPDLPFMAAVSIVSGDIARTRTYLAGKGIRLATDGEDCLITDTASGMGAHFVFHAPGREPFALP